MKWILGGQSVEFIDPPSGRQGIVRAKWGDKICSIRFQIDSDGLWICVGNQVIGLDFQGTLNDQGELEYSALGRNCGTENQGLRVRSEFETAGSGTAGVSKSKVIKVKAQMPGKIIQIKIKSGDLVQKGQPLLVMEAMKMENEIKAVVAGVIEEIKVQAGQNVETGAELIKIRQ